MNAYINYLIEASLGFALLLLAYVILLRKETDFNAKRIFMMLGILSSLLFPFFHLQNSETQTIPSLSNIVSAYWLPEVSISGGRPEESMTGFPHFNGWTYIPAIYIVILIFLVIRFLIQLVSLLRTISQAKGYEFNGFRIIESDNNQSTFSFFHFIFIGQANSLSEDDKKKIIQHETIHARRLHSIDIILLHVVSIIFWFNPLIRSYKKIFVQLHEFEADARAVESTEVNEYCNLLAKVALQSADYQLANHFNNSLTLKRIEMMRTLKHKIKSWKIMALASVLFFLFFILACQDQVMKEAQDIAQNSTMAIDLPKQVQLRLDEMKKASPDKKFIVIEPDQNAADKAADLKRKTADLNPEYITSMDVLKDIKDKNGNVRSFVIIEYNEAAQNIAKSSARNGEIFTIVEESASPDGGMDALAKFIWQNLRYPEDARKEGKKGTVFTQFVVNTDGSISDLVIKQGVDPRLDQAALQVVEAFSKWIPGKQNGAPVRQQFVLPIRFDLSAEKNTSGVVTEVKNQFQISSSAIQNGDKKIISGKIKGYDGNPLAGANIIVMGKTNGTVTDANGNFSIEVEGEGWLAVSYVGYSSEEISF